MEGVYAVSADPRTNGLGQHWQAMRESETTVVWESRENCPYPREIARVPCHC